MVVTHESGVELFSLAFHLNIAWNALFKSYLNNFPAQDRHSTRTSVTRILSFEEDKPVILSHHLDDADVATESASPEIDSNCIWIIRILFYSFLLILTISRNPITHHKFIFNWLACLYRIHSNYLSMRRYIEGPSQFSQGWQRDTFSSQILIQSYGVTRYAYDVISGVNSCRYNGNVIIPCSYFELLCTYIN